ncbi:hypothetical protein JW859_14375 [bacterium]|nr:hypothetical protein [bacterium]
MFSKSNNWMVYLLIAAAGLLLAASCSGGGIAVPDPGGSGTPVVQSGDPDAARISATYDGFMGDMQVAGEAGSVQPGATVRVYVNGNLQHVATADSAGEFSTPLFAADGEDEVTATQAYAGHPESDPVVVEIFEI